MQSPQYQAPNQSPRTYLQPNAILRSIHQPPLNANPSQIGNYLYDTTTPLGTGSSSKVYLAKHIHTHTKSAMKRIPILQDPLSQTLLACYTDALLCLSHRNIVQCYDIIYKQHYCYIFTELCQGSLHNRALRPARHDHKHIKETILQVAYGVSAMLSQGYLHRDLKPANLLLRNGVVKICDMGYCCKLAVGQTEVVYTYNVGSPVYMSPEALIRNVYSEKSEVWSVGVVLYYLLTGRVPFRANDEEELKRVVMEQQIEIVDCPSELWRVVCRCLEKKAEDRPTVSEVINMLTIQPKSSPTKAAETLPQSDKTNTSAFDYLITNELHYISHLYRTQHLSSSSIVLPSNAQLVYLLECMIRMRLSLITDALLELTLCPNPALTRQPLKNKLAQYLVKHSITLPTNPHVLTARLSELVSRHSNPLLPPTLPANDRLLVFSTYQDKTPHKYSLCLHSQAKLRELLSELLRVLSDVRTEEEVSRNEKDLLLLDFLITTFQLNALLITLEHDYARFGKYAYLELIAFSPTVMNRKVYLAILDKSKVLKL